MRKSKSFWISIRSLRYVSAYLDQIDLSPLSSPTRKDITQMIVDLNAILEFETGDLPF